MKLFRAIDTFVIVSNETANSYTITEIAEYRCEFGFVNNIKVATHFVTDFPGYHISDYLPKDHEVIKFVNDKTGSERVVAGFYLGATLEEAIDAIKERELKHKNKEQ